MKTHTQKWLRLKLSQPLFPAMIMLITIFMIAACKDSTTEPITTGQINMMAKYSPSDSPSGMFSMIVPTENAAEPGAIDSLQITRARFVLRDIKFKTQSDSSNFRSAPFVLELNLSSAIQDISVAGVPFGTYRRIEFDVHRINKNDVSPLPVSEQLQFQDFLNGESDGYSIIVSGTTYTGGQGSAFTFRSIVNVKQKIDLVPEIVISQPSPAVNAMMLISSGRWFKSSSGVLLDPSDPQNENTISDNLRASIKVFKDNNKDGDKDAN
ncbi:MAG: hypothetical protein M0P61_03935 [Ignavibacteriaceae bacterium]|jgi:hypothetical protein|nr:hypothetical protein [Ignavibacteriaceae bacterium]